MWRAKAGWIGGLFSGAALALAVSGAAVSPAPPPVAHAAPRAADAAVSVLEPTSYAGVVERVAPAVVTIRTVAAVRTGAALPLHRFFFGDPGDEAPQRRGGLGSGVIVSPDGFVLTNHHVVDGARRIDVELSDRRTLVAELVGTDPPSDLAVLKLPETGLPSVPLGDADRMRVGDVVLAFGNPLGIDQTVTMGILSAKGRSTGLGDGSYEDFLQTDAPINRGNSGGGLVSTRGELVGINTQIVSGSGGSIGIGFAIPAGMAADVMRQLIDSGAVRRGRLGVAVQAVTSDIARSLDLPQVRGALVSSVDEDAPAAEAGLQPGDVILSLDGEPVADYNDLRNQVASRSPGTRVDLGVRRDGRSLSLRATLAEMSALAPAGDAPRSASERGRFGMSVMPLTPELARRLQAEPDRGLVVAEVDPAGLAASAGLRRGDVILEANRKAVSDVKQLEAALEESGDRPALLLVRRQGASIFLTLSSQG
jgi:Do/DeqQ family serine protease